MNEELDKEYVEAVQELLHYAIKGMLSDRPDVDKLPTLFEVETVTRRVLRLAEIAGIAEEDDEEN